MEPPDEEQFRALGQCKLRKGRVAHRFDNKWDTGISVEASLRPELRVKQKTTGSITQVTVWCKLDLKLDAKGLPVDQVWCLVTKG